MVDAFFVKISQFYVVKNHPILLDICQPVAQILTKELQVILQTSMSAMSI